MMLETWFFTVRSSDSVLHKHDRARLDLTCNRIVILSCA